MKTYEILHSDVSLDNSLFDNQNSRSSVENMLPSPNSLHWKMSPIWYENQGGRNEKNVPFSFVMIFLLMTFWHFSAHLEFFGLFLSFSNRFQSFHEFPELSSALKYFPRIFYNYVFTQSEVFRQHSVKMLAVYAIPAHAFLHSDLFYQNHFRTKCAFKKIEIESWKLSVFEFLEWPNQNIFFQNITRVNIWKYFFFHYGFYFWYSNF